MVHMLRVCYHKYTYQHTWAQITATTALDDDSGCQHPCVYYNLAVITCYPTDARAGVTSFETVGVKKTRVPEELRKQR